VTGERVRIGVVGGGLIAQAAHLPNLRRLDEQFELVALADPSARVRDRVGRRFGIPSTYGTWEAMLDEATLDAVAVCTPHSAHTDVILAALDSGRHVFVEKPLCIRLEDADRIVAAQQRSGRVVQVGYMKRFDPAYERLLDALPDDARDLRYVSVVTYDPDMARAPFFRPGELVPADDVPVAIGEAGRRSRNEQLEAELGTTDPVAAHAYYLTYLSALSHDVNLVHGILECLGEPVPAAVDGSSWWADGWAGNGVLRLASGARCSLTWLWLDGLDEFREEVAAYFTDAVHALRFPAPYLGWPARYERRGRARSERTVHPGEAYVEELRHFHACVVDGVPCRTPAAQARLDLQALKAMFLAAGGG
jgi:predicted dehydrogenase